MTKLLDKILDIKAIPLNSADLLVYDDREGCLIEQWRSGALVQLCMLRNGGALEYGDVARLAKAADAWLALPTNRTPML